MEAMGGGKKRYQPLFRGEEEKEELGRGSPQPTTTLAGEDGQEPEPPQVRVADYTPEVGGADAGHQTARQTG